MKKIKYFIALLIISGMQQLHADDGGLRFQEKHQAQSSTKKVQSVKSEGIQLNSTDISKKSEESKKVTDKTLQASEIKK